MNNYEKIFAISLLIFISISSIDWFGKDLFALLSMFNLIIGIIIGVILFKVEKRKNNDNKSP